MGDRSGVVASREFEDLDFDDTPADRPTGGIDGLFERAKDLDDWMSVDRFREIVGTLGGLNEDEIAEMVDGVQNGDGVVEAEAFQQWLYGERVCDEDRELLASFG